MRNEDLEGLSPTKIATFVKIKPIREA